MSQPLPNTELSLLFIPAKHRPISFIAAKQMFTVRVILLKYLEAEILRGCDEYVVS